MNLSRVAAFTSLRKSDRKQFPCPVVCFFLFLFLLLPSVKWIRVEKTDRVTLTVFVFSTRIHFTRGSKRKRKKQILGTGTEKVSGQSVQ